MRRTVRNPRTVLVNFRVSAEEHQKMSRDAEASGARNVSEFCRTKVLTDSTISEQFERIEALLTGANRREAQLDRRMDVIEKEIAHLKTSNLMRQPIGNSDNGFGGGWDPPE